MPSNQFICYACIWTEGGNMFPEQNQANNQLQSVLNNNATSSYEILNRIDESGVYASENRLKIVQEIQSLLERYHSLSYSVHDFVENSGEILNLIKISGHLSTRYNESPIKVPVAFWLPRSFPRVAPIVFIELSSEMQIKPEARNVQLDGRILESYIDTWNMSSSLSHLAVILVSSFSASLPFVLSRKQEARAMSSSLYSNIKNCDDSQSEYYFEDTLNSAREIVRLKIKQKLSCVEKELGQECLISEEKVKLMRSKYFNFNETSMNDTNTNLERTKVSLSNDIDSLQEHFETVQKSLSEIDDSTSLIKASDDKSEQMIELVSKTLAHEDLLSCLGKCLEEECIEFPYFLKKVRRISKQQFFFKQQRNQLYRKQEQNYLISKN